MMNTILDPADTWLLENDPSLAGESAAMLANRRLRQGHAVGVPLDGAPELADLAAMDDIVDYEEALAREARAEAAILLSCTRPRDREIIQRRVEGQEIPEIAEDLGMTRQGVWAALRRLEIAARAAVAAMVRDDGQEQAGLAIDALPLPMVEGINGQMGWDFGFGEVRP